MIEHTITDWASSLGVDYKTLKSALTKAGVRVAPRKPITALQIKVAILGDERAEKLRNLKLDADRKTVELAQIEGRLLSVEIVNEQIAKCFGLVRQAVLSGRAEVPPRANPQDHVTAMTAWTQWENRFFPFVRNGMSATGAVEFPPVEPPPQEAKP